MTITIIPNQITVVTQNLMAIYGAARKCISAFAAEHPDCTEIIIEASESGAFNYACTFPAANPCQVKLQLFVGSNASETELCDLISGELLLVSEAC